MKLRFFSGTILLLFINVATTIAQRPENIVSIAQVWHPNSYYVEQAALWKKETENDKRNTKAWYNYYKANRYMQISGEADSAGSRKRFVRLEHIVSDMERNIPNSFEFNYVKWWNGNNNAALFPYLQKAYQIDPDRKETYLDFVTYYEVKGDIANRDQFLKKWYGTGTVSPGLLNYSYNVLMSLKPDAILVTSGDNDTYYPWVLQVVMGIRKDVTIINTALSEISDYNHNNMDKLGVMSSGSADKSYEEYSSRFIKRLSNNRLHHPVYVALTTNQDFTKPIDSDLYLIGLAYVYSEEKIDNIALLKKNLEREYALDYLTVSFIQDPFASIVTYANSNYIVPMITLYEHYKLSEDKERANYWKEKVKQVAMKCGMEDQIKEYIKD